MNRILNVLDQIIDSKTTEKRACINNNINYLWFRRFIKYKIDADSSHDQIIHVTENDWGCWQEDFLQDLIGASQPAPDGFEEVFDKITSEALTEEEYEVLKLRYQEEFTLEQIGEHIGKTAERVRQILSKIMRRLRAPQYRLPLCFGMPYEQALEEVHTAQVEYDKMYYEKRKESMARLYANAAEVQQQAEKIRAKTAALAEAPIEGFMTLEDIPLQNLGLSVRSCNALTAYFFRSGQALNAQSVANLAGHLKSVRGLGTTSIQEITNVMADQFAIDMCKRLQ